MFIPFLAVSFSLSLLFTQCSPSYEQVYYDALLVHHEGGLLTGGGQFSWVGVNDGKIAGMGHYEKGTDHLPTAKQLIGLEGNVLYPGFIDAHGHIFGYARFINEVNLVGCASIEDCRERIAAYIEQNPEAAKGGWITGRGWDQNLWDSKAFPTASDLADFGDLRIYLVRIDGHAAWVSPSVLDQFGLSNDTRIAGGELKDGVLIDNAMSLVDVPEQHSTFWRKALLRAQDSLLAYGITAVTDAGLSTKQILLLDSLQREGRFHLFVNAMISNTEADLAYFESRGPLVSDLLRVQSVKAYMDGALGSRGALLRAPYHDLPEHYGLPLMTPNELDSLRDRCLKNGWQLCVHAIGDSAHHTVLQSFNQLSREADLRFRVEHAQIMTPEDSAFYAHPNIVASVQPTHATSDMHWAPDRLGPHRTGHGYSYRRLLNAAGLLAFGTDFPIEHIDPLATFQAAVFRQDDHGQPEGGFLPDQRLTAAEALYAMTYGAAYAAFGEQDYGQLTVGHAANFTVLDKLILGCSREVLNETKVKATIIRGKQHFENSSVKMDVN